MTDLLPEVQTMLKGRLAEIREETESLRRALEHMTSSAKRRKGRRPSPQKTRRSAAGRARRGERAGQLVEFITKNPDQRGSAIAKALGMQPSQVYQLGARLEKQGRIEKTKNGYRLKASSRAESE